MLPLLGTLRLTDPIDDEVVILVPAIEWYDLRADGGYHQVDSERAIGMLRGLSGYRLQYVRGFAAETCLRFFDLSRMSDREVMDAVISAIRGRQVVAIEKGAGAQGKAVSETLELRRLLAQIERQTRGRLGYAGRQYKLVVDVDLAGTPGRDSYEVVSHNDALRVLDGLAKQAGATGELGTLLGKASEKLTPDWRPPAEPNGLILLRRNIELRAAVTNYEPAITPSQLRKQKEGWITIEVEDDFGLPWQGELHLVLEDGSSQDVGTNAEGAVHLENIEPGTAGTSIHGLDVKTWEKK